MGLPDEYGGAVHADDLQRRAADDALRIAKKYADGGTPTPTPGEGSAMRWLLSHIGGSGNQGLLLRENEGAAPSIAPYEAIKGAVGKAASGADPSELVPDVTDAAMSVGLAGSPISRPAGSLGTFLGRRQAEDHDADVSVFHGHVN
jgi:hypothetical protein